MFANIFFHSVGCLYVQAALFSIAKMRKQPSIHQQMNGILLSQKKNEILPFTITWIDSEGIVLSKSDRERQILYDIPYMWNLKNTTS